MCRTVSIEYLKATKDEEERPIAWFLMMRINGINCVCVSFSVMFSPQGNNRYMKRTEYVLQTGKLTRCLTVVLNMNGESWL